MIAPVRSRTRSFLIELPAAWHAGGDLDLLELDVGAAAPSRRRRGTPPPAACAIRFAICSPAEEYGWTTRSAPASFSLRAAESSEPRATTKSSGCDRLGREGDEEVDLVRVGGRDEPAGAADPRLLEVAVLGAVAEHDERAVRLRRLERVGVDVDDDVSFPLARSSAATLRPTRP